MSQGPLFTTDKGFELKGDLLVEPGTRPGADVRVHDVAPVGRAGRYTMTDLHRDHTFFSAAVLAATGLAAAPVAVYWAESGLPEQEAPVLIEHQQIVLKGLKPPFDRIVYACPNEHAPGLLKFLGRFAAKRPDGIWESVHQIVPMIDWTTLTSAAIPGTPPAYNTHLYGAESPHGVFYWTPPPDPLKGAVCLTFRRKIQPPKRRAFC